MIEMTQGMLDMIAPIAGTQTILVLHVCLDGLPVSKNRRSMVSRGHLHTIPSADKWMESVRDICRRVRVGSVGRSDKLALAVIVSARHPKTFDIDGALPCLVDAVLAGLAADEENFKRPPDHLVWRIFASKQQHDVDSTEVCVLKLKD